jgi:hypothetical protein
VKKRTQQEKNRASLIEGDEAKKLISEADRLRAISFLLGEVFGILLGVPASIGLGLHTRFVEVPRGDSLGTLVEGLFFLSFTILFGCLIAFVSSVYLWRRKGKINFGNCVLSSLTVLFMWVYVAILLAFLFEPLDAFLLQHFTPVSVFWKGALVFFPFMLLSAYMLFPSIRPIMSNNIRVLYTRQSWKNPRVRKRVKTFWLLLIAIIAVYILNLLWNLLQK